MKTEYLGLSKVADHLCLICAAKSVRGVVYKCEVTAGRNSRELFNLARLAPHMDADNSCGPRRDHPFNLSGVDRMGTRIDVAEDRSDLLPLQSMSGGDERKGRNDYFSVHPQSADRDFQCHRTVADGDTIPSAEKPGDTALQLLNKGAIVTQPSAIEQVINPR